MHALKLGSPSVSQKRHGKGPLLFSSNRQAMMKELGKFIAQIREQLCLAETISVKDDVGDMPEQLELLIPKAEHHLDGAKSLMKRMRPKVSP